MPQRVIYLDNNATTKVAPEVIAGMLPMMEEFYGNPSSMHFFGGEVAKYLTKARVQVSTLLGCNPEEITFTSCGTESNNTAIFGSLDALNNNKRRHLVTTLVEHPAVKNPMASLTRKGYQVTELAVDRQGMLNMDEVRSSITDETALVSVMYANNESGVIFPIEEIGAIAKSRGALFHVDAVQAVGKLPINLQNSTIDMLSLSGHKLHAPKGIGALYIRRGVRMRPLLLGGHQERGRRGGTEAIPNIVGLGIAAELAQKYFIEENQQVRNMRDHLQNWILANIPHTMLNGHPEHRLPNTCNIGFEYIEGEAILLLLSQLGICASSGSACTSGSLEPSHVLRAMNVPFTAVHGSIRFSLSRYNTEQDIDFVIQELPNIIQKLRAMSPFNETSGMPIPDELKDKYERG